MSDIDASAAAGAAADRTRWQAFAISVAVACLTILDLSKINVALPSIADSLGASSTHLQLIVAGYALAFGLMLIPAGRIGDVHSRKVMFLAGLVAFTAASIFCGAATDAAMLVAARICQGLAAGMLMPQVLGLMQEMFHGSARGRAFGTFGAIIGLSTAFGPTLGGLLIALGGEEDGWRWTFWMNAPLAVLLIPFAIRLIPAQQKQGGSTSLDVVGILLIGVSVFCLMLPFVLTTGGAGDDPARWWWLAVSAVAVAAFVLWERAYLRSGRSPVLNLSLLRLGSYRYGLLVGTCYFAAMPAIFLVVVLFLQQGLHMEPVYAGMVSIPFALVSAYTAWLSGRFVQRYGRQLVLYGLIGVTIGFGLTLVAAFFSSAELAPWLMAGTMLLAGIGGGFVISPNQTLTLSQIPVSEGGVAGSVSQVGQRAGNAIGVAAVATAFYSTIYRETGTVSELEVFHDALRNGMLVAGLFLLAAIVFSLLDRGTILPKTGAIPVIPGPAPK